MWPQVMVATVLVVMLAYSDAISAATLPTSLLASGTRQAEAAKQRNAQA
jgi:hypothetical protein